MTTSGVAYADEVASESPEIEIPELPRTLTVEEMESITNDGVIELSLPVDELNAELEDADVDLDVDNETETAPEPDVQAQGSLVIHTAAFRPTITRAGTGGDLCRLDPGNMWERASGNGFRYGGVGSKPRLYGCTAGVRKTGIQSDVYRWNGWNWQKVAGTLS